MDNKKYLKLLLVPLIIILGVGGYLGYKYYQSRKDITINKEDAQNQINYSLGSKKLLDAKPFIDKLPYSSNNFDIYYNSVDDVVQIIMKNKGASFNEAKNADEADVILFLQQIGVNSTSQKIDWFLKQ